MTTWQTISRLPETEPNEYNLAQYTHEQLMAGSSPDARFIYDVVYALTEQCFVLTCMEVNSEWGYLENEVRLYPTTRQELLAAIEQFQTNPEQALHNFQAA